MPEDKLSLEERIERMVSLYEGRIEELEKRITLFMDRNRYAGTV